ncbi:hypothetical protein ABD76_28290 [Paenibacillus dendritiformis]|nr:hypothetical protein [Paenibacillus dendritiformis]
MLVSKCKVDISTGTSRYGLHSIDHSVVCRLPAHRVWQLDANFFVLFNCIEKARAQEHGPRLSTKSCRQSFFLGREGPGKAEQVRLGQAGPRMKQAGPRIKLLHRRSIFNLNRLNSEKILKNYIISTF